jgi:hypothetical protein
MTSPLTLTVDPNGRKMAKPVEEVARAWFISEGGPNCDGLEWVMRGDEVRDEYRLHARAALNTLRRLGFINDIGLVAIKAEEAVAA